MRGVAAGLAQTFAQGDTTPVDLHLIYIAISFVEDEKQLVDKVWLLEVRSAGASMQQVGLTMPCAAGCEVCGAPLSASLVRPAGRVLLACAPGAPCDKLCCTSLSCGWLLI